MNPGRIGTLLIKELKLGATNFFFAYALVMPIILSLLVGLVFGDLLTENARMGIYDAGDSGIATTLSELDYITTTVYASEADLRDSVERGTVSTGVIFPQGFDAALAAGAEPDLTILNWSESLPKNTAVIMSAIADALGQPELQPAQRISIESVQLGDATFVPWADRLLPMIVLMTIIMGGVMVPAASLVDEKQRRTLSALTITPASLLEVYASKALLGMGISILMGLIVLVLNNAFGSQPALLVSVLSLAALASSIFGVLLGSFVRDINVLLAVIKAGGLVLFAPALIQIVPSIPQWIAQLFPTYYMINPVMEVSQNGAGFEVIAGEMAILLAIIGAMIVALALVLERQQKQLALAS